MTQNIDKIEKVDFLHLLVEFIRFIKKQLLLILVCITIGLGMGFLYYSQQPPLFKTQMSAFSSNLTSEQIVDLMQDLSRLFKERDYLQIYQKSNLSESTVKKVASMECKPYVSLETLNRVEDDQKLDQIFLVTVEVKDVSMLDSLEQGILYYIENNSYVKKRVSLNLVGIEKEMEKVENEIKDLETLKFQMQNLLKSNQNKSNLFLSDMGNISSQIIALYQKFSSLKYSRQFADRDIRIIKNFAKFKKKSSPSLTLSLLGGMIVSLSLGILYLIVKKLMVLLNQPN